VAPKDGTTLITMLPTNAVEPQMGNRNARWDTLALNWIGTLTRDSPSCVVSGKSGVKSIEDAKTREIVFGATGWSSTMAQHPATLANLFGYKIKVVVGYPGIAPTFQAVAAGEVDGLCSFYTSQALYTQKREMEAGELIPVVQMGTKKDPVFRDAPLIHDLAKTEEQRTILQFVFGLAELARPLAVPPGVPAERVAALRKAFWAAATSPELKTDASRSGMIINPVNGADTEAAFRDAVSSPRETLERVRSAIRLQ
jgi:tripartite-type tricarboxylate transporter receptor subunit TctC